jgi:hypothetical protein
MEMRKGSVAQGHRQGCDGSVGSCDAYLPFPSLTVSAEAPGLSG